MSVDILLQPRSSRVKIGPLHGDRIKVSVSSPPVEGAANDALVQLFAKTLRVARGDIEITHGQHSRRKTLRIRGIDRATFEARVQ